MNPFGMQHQGNNNMMMILLIMMMCGGCNIDPMMILILCMCMPGGQLGMCEGK